MDERADVVLVGEVEGRVRLVHPLDRALQCAARVEARGTWVGAGREVSTAKKRGGAGVGVEKRKSFCLRRGGQPPGGPKAVRLGPEKSQKRPPPAITRVRFASAVLGAATYATSSSTSSSRRTFW